MGAAVGAAVGVCTSTFVVASVTMYTTTPSVWESVGLCASSLSEVACVVASASVSAKIVTVILMDAALTARLIKVSSIPVAVASDCLKLASSADPNSSTVPATMYS
eukprot:4079543-Prymnesium_polylepis.1